MTCAGGPAVAGKAGRGCWGRGGRPSQRSEAGASPANSCLVLWGPFEVGEKTKKTEAKLDIGVSTLRCATKYGFPLVLRTYSPGLRRSYILATNSHFQYIYRLRQKDRKLGNFSHVFKGVFFSRFTRCWCVVLIAPRE
jgi:hypothetical protein